jgi:hypothetical protein
MFSAVDGAQTHGYQVAPDAAAFALMPELRTAPAPSWVKPGMRILYHQMSASVPTGDSTMVEDPDGKWYSKATGKHFREDENPGTGGQGYLQVDIVATPPDAVVSDCRSYLIHALPAEQATIAATNGYVNTPGVLSEVYANPDVKRKYLDLNGNGITSRRAPYKAAGKTFDAVWQQTITDGGSITYVFGIDSGLILHSASCSVTKATNFTVNGVSQLSGGGTELTQSTLVSIRQIKTPWTQGKLPPVMRDLHELDYEGAQQTWIPGGAQLPPAPVQTRMKVIGRGDDFVQLQFSGVMMIGNARSDLGTSNLVSGPTMLTPMAIDPADLAQLHQGQELDRDPVTNAVTYVSFMGPDRAGHDLATISLQFPGGQNNFHSDCVYDRNTGLLVANSYTNPFLHQLMQVSLKGKN